MKGRAVGNPHTACPFFYKKYHFKGQIKPSIFKEKGLAPFMKEGVYAGTYSIKWRQKAKEHKDFQKRLCWRKIKTKRTNRYERQQSKFKQRQWQKAIQLPDQ